MHVSSGPSLTLCSGGTLLDPPYPLPPSTPNSLSYPVEAWLFAQVEQWPSPPTSCCRSPWRRWPTTSSSRGSRDSPGGFDFTEGQTLRHRFSYSWWDRWGDIHGRESSISKLFLLDIKLTAILLYLLPTIMTNQTEVNDVGESLKGHFGRVIQQGSSILRHFCCDAQSQIIQPPVNKRSLHFNF